MVGDAEPALRPVIGTGEHGVEFGALLRQRRRNGRLDGVECSPIVVTAADAGLVEVTATRSPRRLQRAMAGAALAIMRMSCGRARKSMSSTTTPSRSRNKAGRQQIAKPDFAPNPHMVNKRHSALNNRGIFANRKLCVSPEFVVWLQRPGWLHGAAARRPLQRTGANPPARRAVQSRAIHPHFTAGPTSTACKEPWIKAARTTRRPSCLTRVKRVPTLHLSILDMVAKMPRNLGRNHLAGQLAPEFIADQRTSA